MRWFRSMVLAAAWLALALPGRPLAAQAAQPAPLAPPLAPTLLDQPVPAAHLQPAPTQPAREPFVLTSYVENDGGYIKPNSRTDRYYSNGVKVSLGYQPAWADAIAAWMPGRGSFTGGPTAGGFFAGQSMFTPNHTSRVNPDPDDAPYAGWLYAGAFWQRADLQHRLLDHLELAVGVVGPASLADDTQRWFHHVIGADQPEGWNQQLRQEIAFDLKYTRKWRLPLLQQGQMGLELIPQAGFTLGTVHRLADAQATLRWGWNLPRDFGIPRLDDLPAATNLARPQATGFYFFVSMGGQAVEHDLFLEGNTFRNSAGVRARPLVARASAGVALQLGEHLQVTYAQTYLSDQFYGQEHTAAYGALTLSFTASF